MDWLPKLLIGAGAVLVLAGLLLHFGGKLLPKLPGDIVVERENFRFYFPIATCLLLSAVATVVFYVINYFRK